MRAIIGILLFILAICAGLYVGVWLCFIGGIVQIIEEIRAEELSALSVAIGVARIFFAGLAGWITFVVGAIIAKLTFGD